MMQLSHYINRHYKGNNRAFARDLVKHPLMRTANVNSIAVTLTLILRSKERKPGLHFIAAVEDLTNGEITWLSWLELLEPEYVRKHRRKK